VSVRTFFGFCEHGWQDTGHIEGKVPNLWRTSLDEPAFLTSNIYVTQRCTKCGKVRSVKL
jgi:hypothetical protein